MTIPSLGNDDIDLSLENIDKRWFGEEWFPEDGDSITASIVKEDGMTAHRRDTSLWKILCRPD